MNPNFDFRDSGLWDDREIQESVGDFLEPADKALNWSAAVIAFVIVVLGGWTWLNL